MPPPLPHHPLRLAMLFLFLLSVPALGKQPQEHNKRDATHPPYLSSSARQAPPKFFGLFSYARNPADLGPYDALLEVQDVLLHRGLTTVQMGDSVMRPMEHVLGVGLGAETSQRRLGFLEGAGPGVAISPARGGQVLWAYAEEGRGDLHRETARREARQWEEGQGSRHVNQWHRAALERRYDDGMWHPEAPGGSAAYDDGQWHGDGSVGTASASGNEGQADAESVVDAEESDEPADDGTNRQEDQAGAAGAVEAAAMPPDQPASEDETADAQPADEQQVQEQPSTEPAADDWSAGSPPTESQTPGESGATSTAFTVSQVSYAAVYGLPSEVPSISSTATSTERIIAVVPPAPTAIIGGELASSDNDDDGEWEWVEDDGSPLPSCDEAPPSAFPLAGAPLASSSGPLPPLVSPSASASAVINTSTLVPMQTFQTQRGVDTANSSIRIGKRNGVGYEVTIDRRLLDEVEKTGHTLQRRRKNEDKDGNDYEEEDVSGGHSRRGQYSSDDNADDRGDRDKGNGLKSGQYDDDSDEHWEDDTRDYDRSGGKSNARPNKHGGKAAESDDDEDDYGHSSSSGTSSGKGAHELGTSSTSQGVSGGTLRDDCATLVQFFRAMSGDEWTNKAGWAGGEEADCCSWYGVICGPILSRRAGVSDVRHARGWKDDYEDDYREDGRGGKGRGKSGSRWDNEADDRNDSNSGDDGPENDRTSNRKASGTNKGKQWEGSEGDDDDEDWSGGNKDGRGGRQTQGSNQSGPRRVVAVDLARNGLKGTLSDALFALDGLLHIDISGNAISSIPDCFASLPRLTLFKAANNSITGPVPASLSASQSLTNLNLANNTFSGDLSLSTPCLLSLSVTGNRLSAVSLNAPKIQRVYLANNAFKGPLPDLSQASGLTTLIASNNSFTGSLFELSGLTNLTHLDVRSNQLTGVLPTSLSTLKSLKSLYLSSNQITGSLPSGAAPPPLTSCSVQPNPITCPSESELADPGSLASRCYAACRKTQAAGIASTPDGGVQGQSRLGTLPQAQKIPVAPLPGEAGQAQAQAQAPSLQPALGAPQSGLLSPAMVAPPAIGVGNTTPPGAMPGSVGAVHPFLGENTNVRVAKGSGGKSVGGPAGVNAVSIVFTIMTTATMLSLM